MKLSIINKFHTLAESINCKKKCFSLQKIMFCPALERARSNFLCIIEWKTMICNFSMDDPRYTFDLHELFAETIITIITPSKSIFNGK